MRGSSVRKPLLILPMPWARRGRWTTTTRPLWWLTARRVMTRITKSDEWWIAIACKYKIPLWYLQSSSMASERFRSIIWTAGNAVIFTCGDTCSHCSDTIFCVSNFPSYLSIFLYHLLRPAEAGQKRMSRLPTSFENRNSMFLCTGFSATSSTCLQGKSEPLWAFHITNTTQKPCVV